MEDILLVNIGQLLQIDRGSGPALRGRQMAELPYLADAYLFIQDGRIADFGPMAELDAQKMEGFHARGKRAINCSGRLVMPAFVDSHTHLVFAGERSAEFVQKIQGATYAQIAAGGGGILNTVKKTRATTERELFDMSIPRIWAAMEHGTATFEIKSGYGLNLQDELKMLRVARSLGQLSHATVRTTLLAAHALPPEFKNQKDKYVDHVVREIIPAAASEGLADFVDVFCETAFFSTDDTGRIIEAGLKHGLPAKIHANQLNRSGGVQVATQMGALSADHLESVGQEEIDLLAQHPNTLPTLLPGAAFFLRMDYPPARQMIDAGLALVLASDFNPGSAHNFNLQNIFTLACVPMRMSPNEALNALTFNAACALKLQGELGSIDRGKLANLFITQPMSSIDYIPYAWGQNHVWRTCLKGYWT